jgi:hypothetical protein
MFYQNIFDENFRPNNFRGKVLVQTLSRETHLSIIKKIDQKNFDENFRFKSILEELILQP